MDAIRDYHEGYEEHEGWNLTICPIAWSVVLSSCAVNRDRDFWILACELSLNGLSFPVQHQLPVEYTGIQPDCGYRIDLLFEGKRILRLKVVGEIKGIALIPSCSLCFVV